MRRIMGLGAGLAILVMAVVSARPAAAASPSPDITFGRPAASITYGTGIEFSVVVELGAPVERAELLLRFPATPGPLLIPVDTPSGPSAVLRYTLAEADGHILPNTRIEATWRLWTEGDGGTVTSPTIAVTYADDRFTWQTIDGSIVHVHWVTGPQSFGERALSIAEQGIEKAESLLGVTETEPVDFFIYPDQDSFYQALGPATRENVGGEADPDIRTLFALITPDEIDAAWVGTVIPHELTHLVFDTAVRNPYHFPPRWLNEGLAVYLSAGYQDSDRQLVRAAVADGTLLPLPALSGQFPTSQDGFYLAYAESVSSLDFLIRTYGQSALVALVASYADGKTDDEAFQAALGVDVAGFDAAWFADVGATVPAAIGPRPDPLGPLPSGWTGPGGMSGASPGPNGPSGPGPGGGGSGSQVPAAGVSDALPWLGLGSLGVGVALAAVALVRRRRASSMTATGPDVGASEPPDR